MFGSIAFHTLKQGCHGEFEPGKAQYSTPNFFDRLSLIRAYLNLKSRERPGHGGFDSCGSPAEYRNMHVTPDSVGEYPQRLLSMPELPETGGQISEDILTTYQPGGWIMPTTLLLDPPPGFSDLPTAPNIDPI